MGGLLPPRDRLQGMLRAAALLALLYARSAAGYCSCQDFCDSTCALAGPVRRLPPDPSMSPRCPPAPLQRGR